MILSCGFQKKTNTREISSASYFHDFQTRRGNIKYKAKDGSVKFAHSLNCTAIPTPRILVSLIENYQNADGSITVPEVLRPYMGGQEKIGVNCVKLLACICKEENIKKIFSQLNGLISLFIIFLLSTLLFYLNFYFSIKTITYTFFDQSPENVEIRNFTENLIRNEHSTFLKYILFKGVRTIRQST
jgi:hypothetical protein